MLNNRDRVLDTLRRIIMHRRPDTFEFICTRKIGNFDLVDDVRSDYVAVPHLSISEFVEDAFARVAVIIE